MRDVAQEIISRRKKRVLTIDKAWDGNEGFIAWYCLFQDGKFYPISVRKLGEEVVEGRIIQIEYENPFLFFVFDNGILKRFNLNSGLFSANFHLSINKIGTINIGNERYLIRYYNPNLYFTRISDFTYSLLNISNVKDIGVFKNRIFLIREESGKNVLYFSRSFMNAPPQIFFYNPASPSTPFFTFPENFSVLPYHSFYFLYQNFLITDSVIYQLEERRYGNVIQYVPVPLFSYGLKTPFRIQGVKNGLFWGDENGFYTIRGEYISDRTIKHFISTLGSFTLENPLFASIKDENLQIDFFKDEGLFLVGSQYLIRQVWREDGKYNLIIFRFSSFPEYIFRGKLYLITSLDESLYYKYIRKIKILPFIDRKINYLTNYSFYEPDIYLPIGLKEKITEESFNLEEGNYTQVRGVGVKFLFEIDIEKGLLPVFEIEYDGGK